MLFFLLCCELQLLCTRLFQLNRTLIHGQLLGLLIDLKRCAPFVDFTAAAAAIQALIPARL